MAEILLFYHGILMPAAVTEYNHMKTPAVPGR